MNRELQELKLSKSKLLDSVSIVTYFNRREATAIEKIRWDNTIYAMDQVSGEARLQSMNGGYIIEQQNKELCLGIKKIVYKDKTVKEGDTLTEDDILDIPDADVTIIMKELSKCWNDSEAKDDEKKSQSSNSPVKSET